MIKRFALLLSALLSLGLHAQAQTFPSPTVQNFTVLGTMTASGLPTSGTIANSLCQTSAGSVLSVAGANCFGGGGGGGISGLVAGQLSIAGSPTTLTSSIPFGVTGTGSFIPAASGGLLSPGVLPLASASSFGAAECDNTTITCPGGVFSAVSGGSGNVVSPGSGFTVGDLIKANNTAGTAILDANVVAANVVTSSGTLTNNFLLVGVGAKAVGQVASLGTTTTLLHGNAAGLPSFGSVVLTTDVTGNLPVTNLNSGTSASSTTFWRGDATWATPSAGSAAFNAITSGTNTTAAMLVGTGASLGPTGSGTLTATNVPTALGTGTVCSTAGPLSVSAGCPIIPTVQAGASFALVAGNAGQLVLATNASPTTISLAQSTGSLGTGWGTDLFTEGNTSTLTPATSKINNQTTIKLGAYQDIALAADSAGNYVGSASVPWPTTQTHTTCLFDDFVWSACTGSGTLTASGSITNGSLGIWASGTSLSGTVLPGTGVLTFLATPSSANLAAAVTGETGTGALVFGTSPTIASPAFTGTPTAPTATVGTNTTQLATTAFVIANAAGTPVIFVGAGAGTANAQTVATTTPSGFTLTNQFVVRFSAGATNTAAATLNVNSTGATAIDKQLSSGFAALSGGEIVSGLEYDATYNSTCTCFVLTNTPGSAIVNNATSATVTAIQWANGTLFNVTTAAQTITLPVATTLASNGNIFINAIGNSVTLQPNAADGVNGGSIGSSVTVASGVFAVVSTVGSSGTGAITANPLTGGSGSGTVNAGTSTHLAYYASSTNAVSSNTHLTETGTKSGIDYNTGALPTAVTGTVVQAASADTVATRFEADAFGAQAFYTGVCYGGTNASPTPIAANGQCGGYNSYMYNGASAIGPLASIRTFAAENQSSGHGGSYVEVATTPIASTTLASIIRFENDGGITVPSTVTGGDKGAGTINAAGLYVNGVAVGTSSGNVTATSMTTNHIPYATSSTGITNSEISDTGGTGGVVVGSATGGQEGNGTLNATGLYVNGVSVAATGLTTGTSVSLAGPSQFFVCTTTCTVTPPVPVAGYQFCVMNDDNISSVITMAALGSSALYENTARTAYGTAGTGTLTSGGAVGDMVCIVGRDSTHYLTTTFKGTWTAS